MIHWDIKRTYVGHDYFQEASGREALYKICKAYSVYDEEVGYCQGFSFMAATLLLQVRVLLIAHVGCVLQIVYCV